MTSSATPVLGMARDASLACAGALAVGGRPVSSLNMVFLLGGLGVGGAERQAMALAASLHRRGERVHVLALEDGPLGEAARSDGVPLTVLGRPFGFSPATLPRLGRFLRYTAPDVVYAFLEVQWLLALAAARTNRGTRVVLGLRTSRYERGRSTLRERVVFDLVRRSARQADLLIANSTSGLASFNAQCGVLVPGMVVPNGIDASALRQRVTAGNGVREAWGIPDGSTVVGHVGRLDPVKNHELLLDAFARLARSDSRLWLVCVGQGTIERRTTLVRRAERLGIASRVVFAGRRHDLADVYATFDVLALSSIREGFPNVVAEAMACGVPAVVTDTGAAGEIVGELGEVVSEAGAEAFAAGLHALLRRTSSTLSDACRSLVSERFTIDRSADRTLDAFQSLFR